MYAKSGITIAVFYLNYFILIPYTLVRNHQRWKFLGWNVLVVLGADVMIWFIFRVLSHPHNHTASLAWLSYIFRDTIMIILAISLAVALKLSGRWREVEEKHRKLLAVRNQSELDSLRSHLNPHFLFNTLNTIYALIAVSPEKAQNAVHKLSALLRYVVYENPRKVLVDNEVQFVENYVELMRMRMGNRPVELVVDRHGDESTEIAPLIFVTLVENAFKHGNTSNNMHPIKVMIKSDGTSLMCSTENYTDESNMAENGNGGVGLVNLRRRLELLYGSRARLSSSLSANGLYCATLTIEP